ncbi:Gx transporter family protein [Haploplasma axanthum]|uniref:Heptaprenyl diphosphate synthase component I n=1 Tax=Haploplasma axanthum TaxID=29552 RepID=A0A449BBC6_HAPAX|nr:Gx transporter family protein [Haploplasma axanthum]VEU79661.1 Heptaprenyl diphosphate synthase component I [Haploplasma axanthum]
MTPSKKKSSIKKMVLLANLTAAAIILSIIESGLQIIPVPGAKLGLANLITLVVLYLYSYKEALLVTLLRIFLTALLSGGLGPTFYMGLAGGVLAITVMAVTKQVKLGVSLVSLLGSISHQVGQIIVGIYVLGSDKIVYYLFLMIPIGIVTGLINGIIAEKFLLNIRNKQDNNE